MCALASMDWKNFIVFADSSEAGLTRVRATLDLAALSQAHVEVRCLYKPPQIPIGFDLPALDPAYDRLVKTAHAQANETVKSITTLATPGPMFSVHAQSTGDVSVSHCAALAVFGADLAVAALPESDPKELDLVHGALFAGGAPCLLTPGWIKPHAWGRRVMIAWKATPQAARALRAALPLLPGAKSVRLLLVDPRGAAAGEDAEATERIAARLLRWGVRIESPILCNPVSAMRAAP